MTEAPSLLQLSYSLNSLKGAYIGGLYRGVYRVIGFRLEGLNSLKGGYVGEL